MKKILWCDTETTGLDATRHGIIQLAMLMDIDGEIKGEVELKIQPFPEDTIEVFWRDIWGVHDHEFILPVNELRVLDVSTYPSPFIQIKSITDFFDTHISKFDKNDKAWVGGYNIGFDLDALSAFCKKVGFPFLGSYINWQRLDVLHALYQQTYKDGTSYADYKLSTICELYGIELEAHNALSDIKATRELWYKLQEME